jgi:hypothetical protein
LSEGHRNKQPHSYTGSPTGSRRWIEEKIKQEDKQMTKAQLKEIYREWNRDLSINHFDKRDEWFKELQELNGEYGDGHKWCDAALNLKGLLGTEKETKAFDLYNRIQQEEGAWEAFKNLALATNNFKI